MKVTVCELSDDRSAFEHDWLALVDHIRENGSDWVLLPDMPFCKWPEGAGRRHNDNWADCVRAHDASEGRLADLAPALVLGSRPIAFGNERYDEAFAWDRESGLRSVHASTNAEAPEFTPLEVRGVRIGFLIGKELWAPQAAHAYDDEDIDVLAIPRCGGAADLGGWLERATLAASVSRAYILSSNRSGAFGGNGWIIAPDGHVLGLTTSSQPFLTQSIEIQLAPVDAPAPEAWPAPDWMDPLDTGVSPF